MRIHDLEFKGEALCDAVYGGTMTYVICKNDENYKIGDLIHPIAVGSDGVRMEHPVNFNTYRIHHITNGTGKSIVEGYCVFSIGFVSSSASVTCGT